MTHSVCESQEILCGAGGRGSGHLTYKDDFDGLEKERTLSIPAKRKKSKVNDDVKRCVL